MGKRIIHNTFINCVFIGNGGAGGKRIPRKTGKKRNPLLPKAKPVNTWKSARVTRSVPKETLHTEITAIPPHMEYTPVRKTKRVWKKVKMESIPQVVPGCLPVFVEYEKPSLFSRLVAALITGRGKKRNALSPHTERAELVNPEIQWNALPPARNARNS